MQPPDFTATACFNLSAWFMTVAPLRQNALTPDEAIHLRNSLNAYIGWLRLTQRTHEPYGQTE